MSRKLFAIAAVLLVAIGLAACGSSSDESATGAESGDPPLLGAGSGMIEPLMSKWQQAYEEGDGTGEVKYEVVGNGISIKPLANREVHFADSNAPVTPVQFSEGGSISMVPWAATGVAIVYNVKGAPPNLRLNGEVLGNIFLGEITKWNDPAIAALNPGANLPPTQIVAVHRTDEAAEDYIVSNYLSEASRKFEKNFGIITRTLDISPKVGVDIKGKEAVIDLVKRTNGALAYLQLPYAVESGLDIAEMESGDGSFSPPDDESIAAGAEDAVRVGPNNEVWVQKQRSSADGYPMVTFSYAVVPWETKLSGPLKKFLLFAFSPKGQAIVAENGFVPVPERLVKAGRRTAKRIYYAYG